MRVRVRRIRSSSANVDHPLPSPVFLSKVWSDLWPLGTGFAGHALQIINAVTSIRRWRQKQIGGQVGTTLFSNSAVLDLYTVRLSCLQSIGDNQPSSPLRIILKINNKNNCSFFLLWTESSDGSRVRKRVRISQEKPAWEAAVRGTVMDDDTNNQFSYRTRGSITRKQTFLSVYEGVLETQERLNLPLKPQC